MSKTVGEGTYSAARSEAGKYPGPSTIFLRAEREEKIARDNICLVDAVQALAESADQQRVPVGTVKAQHIDGGFPFGGINNLANPQQGSASRYRE